MHLPDQHQKITIAHSKGGRPIDLARVGTGPLPILLLGGVHGNESEGFLFLERFYQVILEGRIQIDPKISLFLCPRLNPDGCHKLRRTNQNNVDLNRNLPTKDWDPEFQDVRYYPGPRANSEIESQITIQLIRSIKPTGIISLHSYKHAMINYNGPCQDWAEYMSQYNHLPPKGDIGYPTPGSLGTWAGWERSIPTITLEVLRDQDPEAVWQQHQEGLWRAIEYYKNHPAPENREYTN